MKYEDLAEIKDKWKSLGFLLSNQHENKYYDFTIFRRFIFIGACKSDSGYWDDFSAHGAVYTNGLTFRKCRHILEDGEVQVINQIMIGKWVVSWVIEKIQKEV